MRRGIRFGKVMWWSTVVRIRVSAVFVPGGALCETEGLIVTGLGC